MNTPKEEGEELTEAQIQFQIQVEGHKAKIGGVNDEFIRDIFALVVTPVIIKKVLPLVDKVCNNMLGALSPKSKVSIPKFRHMM